MMRMMFRFLFHITLFIAVSAAMTGISSGQVLINEYMPDPARDWDGDGAYDYRSDEWVEIINTGDSSVDLNTFLLRDAGDQVLWRYGFSGYLAPGETRVVYGSDAVAWEESNGFPAYGLSLNNAGDEIILCRVMEAETLVVDTAGFGRSAVDDRSIGRTLADAGIWAIYDAWNPCSDSCSPPGNGCIPTPGEVNDCITSVAERSWGSIKMIETR
ncbi:MAG TPA: lamin tail domain-containing protein [Candidatus Eisenbacteria bacterium]|uniref:Lamin tail domain-containing protein n=1 Tax=Eiseniibacteriota bacterium TaxID=2212470 RepID=A0A7V2AVV8_UNCEI|nr:lamin tail domain-containing protein [Candidatus Eisenbacteria bacterium]